MNIYITKGNRPNVPFLLSIENKEELEEGQTEFVSKHTSDFVTGFSCTCTQATYDAIKDTIGTMIAPALIASATSPVFPNRQNVYIENNSLKLVTA